MNLGTPEVDERINMRDTEIIFKLHPESLINVLRIYVFKFVMFIEK